MKRYLVWSVLLLALFVSTVTAQVTTNPPLNYTLTYTVRTGQTASTAMSLLRTTGLSATVACRPVGTVSASTLKVQNSADASSWSDSASLTCTSAANSTFSVVGANYLRITDTTFSGSGSIEVTVWISSSQFATAIANTTAPGLPGFAVMGWDGAAYQRWSFNPMNAGHFAAEIGIAATQSDGVGNGAWSSGNNQTFGFGAANSAYNGTTWDRFRTASLANSYVATSSTGINSIGAPISEKGFRWRVLSNPAAGSQATASIAAEANVRHIVDCIAFSAAATTAPALTRLDINVRDGATGAGTIIWTYTVAVAAATGTLVAPVNFCGLNLTGTTNTAMTLEFSASLANLIENVSMSGFNVN